MWLKFYRITAVLQAWKWQHLWGLWMNQENVFWALNFHQTKVPFVARVLQSASNQPAEYTISYHIGDFTADSLIFIVRGHKSLLHPLSHVSNRCTLGHMIATLFWSITQHTKKCGTQRCTLGHMLVALFWSLTQHTKEMRHTVMCHHAHVNL